MKSYDAHGGLAEGLLQVAEHVSVSYYPCDSGQRYLGPDTQGYIMGWGEGEGGGEDLGGSW